MKTLFATQDIRSYNRSPYASQNDPLTLIRSDGIVAIVETEHGSRFPCLVEMLSDNEVVVLVEESIEEPVAQLKLW